MSYDGDCRFPRREDVERSNAVRMRGIDGREQTYTAYDGGLIVDPQQRDKMLQNFMAPKRLVLKEGAQVRPPWRSPFHCSPVTLTRWCTQVMLIKNLVQGVLVNGTVGHVIALKTPIDARRDRLDIAGINMSTIDLPQGARDRESFDSVKERVWPLVRFENGRELLCIPQDFTVENGDGRMEARRVQVSQELEAGSWATRS